MIADVRDLRALQAGIISGITEFGDVDIMIANAGVVGVGLKDLVDSAPATLVDLPPSG